MHEMGEMKRAQELRVDEVSVQKIRENHETIQHLTSQIQQMQEQMNCMYESGDFQDVESYFCGRLSHVSGQPEVIPSSRSMLSRDKRLPLDTWNTSGLQGNVFGNQFSTFDSSRNHLRWRRRAKQEHSSNADFCKKAVDHEFINTGGNSAGSCGWTAEQANIGAAIR